MIIKIFGMIIIMFSSVMLGRGVSECMAARERELSNLGDAISFMSGELGYTHLCMREIIFRVTPYVNGVCGEFFQCICDSMQKGESASFAWSNAILVKGQLMSLKKEDIDYIQKTSHFLEAYELEEQIKCLDAMGKHIRELASRAGDVKRKNSRIVNMLGVYGGMLLCILVF